MTRLASKTIVETFPGPEELAREGARRIARLARAAIRARSVCHLALAGGRTPRLLYQELADSGPDVALDWRAVHVFVSDERHVPPEHADSNYRMAHESLLSRVPIPPEHVHRMRTELGDAAVVAAEYEQEIVRVFSLRPGQLPRFDVILLGMGSDGHTASLFPHTPVLHETRHMVAAVWVPALQTSRITLTLSVINSARDVLVLVSGVEKAETLRKVLEDPAVPERLPAQAVKPKTGRLLWLVDQAAASGLTGRRAS